MIQYIRLHNMVKHTCVLGPGKRAAIWFQGCKRLCKGCMSPDSRPLDGGRVISVENVYDEISKIEDIEGITISGGEPFLQIEGLYLLLKLIRKHTSLSVIIYTGFTVEQLHLMNNPMVDEILNGLIDIIIDGEYIEELNDGISLRGSFNQRVVFITDRYKEESWMYERKQRDTEVIATNRNLFLIGIPTKNDFKKWTKVADEIKSES